MMREIIVNEQYCNRLGDATQLMENDTLQPTFYELYVMYREFERLDLFYWLSTLSHNFTDLLI